ncbi:MAG: sigma-70 family RNA polymerase sigma factor [Acidobacteria bacterium]|nr:sigma-70 family RNA polymerase sigma factor [Acidobacteriota bacterium]
MTQGIRSGNLSPLAGSPTAEASGERRDLDAAAVVEAHADFVHSICRRLTRDTEEARELFQESFVRILNGLPAFREDASVRTWICQIVMNTDRNRRRWWSRFRRNFQAAEPAPGAAGEGPGLEPADRGAGPERAAMGAEARSRIESALAALPDDQRLAVVLRDVEGMSYEEIAAATGVEVGTVKSRIGRARAALRVRLADLVDRAKPEASR